MNQENKNNVVDHPMRYARLETAETLDKKKPNYLLRRIGAGAAALITVASTYGVVKSGADYLHSSSDTQNVPSRTETANPGDTLWDMSDEVKNVDDRRKVIDWMEKSSPDLADGSLDVGDHVTIPLDEKDLG